MSFRHVFTEMIPEQGLVNLREAGADVVAIATKVVHVDSKGQVKELPTQRDAPSQTSAAIRQREYRKRHPDKVAATPSTR